MSEAHIFSSSVFRLLSIATLATATPAYSAVVYTETFSHSSGNNSALDNIGWSGYYGTAGTAVTQTGNDNRAGSGTGNGPDGTKGYLFSANGLSSNTSFALFDNDFTSVAADSISWRMGNTGTNVQVNVLIEQGGNWYVSTQNFTTTAVATASEFASSAATQNFTFSLSAATWAALNFTPDSVMTVGSTLTTDLASNVIDSIGFFVTHNGAPTSTMRIDDLKIEGTIIPEPSTMIMVAFFGLALPIRRRK